MLTDQMSNQVNGVGNADAQAVDAAHKLAATHITTPGLSTSNQVTPDSESELHSPHPVAQLKPPHPSHLHPLTTVSENASTDDIVLNEPAETPYVGGGGAPSMDPSASSRGGAESSAFNGFHGSKSVSDQAFPFPNGE
jgi:hypothetical protein